MKEGVDLTPASLEKDLQRLQAEQSPAPKPTPAELDAKYIQQPAANDTARIETEARLKEVENSLASHPKKETTPKVESITEHQINLSPNQQVKMDRANEKIFDEKLSLEDPTHWRNGKFAEVGKGLSIGLGSTSLVAGLATVGGQALGYATIASIGTTTTIIAGGIAIPIIAAYGGYQLYRNYQSKKYKQNPEKFTDKWQRMKDKILNR